MHTNEQGAAFRRRFFPGATAREWSDWRWQLRRSLRDANSLGRILRLTDDERAAIAAAGGRLPVSVTPYYASLLDPDDSRHGLRRTVIPVRAEQHQSPGEYADPLGEDSRMAAPGLVHTYPDKVLFLVTDRCPVYCRYCTRSRLVGGGKPVSNTARWEKALLYVRNKPEVRDVLISGGEPFTLSDAKIEWLLRRLRAIPHVEIVRFSTKAPASLPQRITPALVRMLRKYQPLWLSVHFTHPDELTPEAGAACARLADAGIPMCSQTVLLKGVNDDPATMRRLMTGLLRVRVKPYYLHQCDAVFGSAHFRTPVSAGLDLIRGLHGHTTGYAVPAFMIDAPGGGGKVPVSPEYIVGRDGDDLILRNYRGKEYRYRDAAGETDGTEAVPPK